MSNALDSVIHTLLFLCSSLYARVSKAPGYFAIQRKNVDYTSPSVPDVVKVLVVIELY